MMLSTGEWRKRNPSPGKQIQEPALVASSSRNSNGRKQPQAQKGKGKAPDTKAYSQGYRIPKIQQDAMETVFGMARAIMKMQKREEDRLKYQKLFLVFWMKFQLFT
ncbi:hypothetical protein O181_116388 [Austropuccinia psidii MF-1]|uniref:Uncharacterized protein n=1 Tax=Austropuccinia psidii MF-1 TaxID=1389203 RepID=A0A9Q3K875_9BASI|nr:hypothetical protein [Austropuccinia psidii MF-1]